MQTIFQKRWIYMRIWIVIRSAVARGLKVGKKDTAWGETEVSYHRKWWCHVTLHCSHYTWIIPWLEFITLEDPSEIQGIWQGKIAVWKQLLVKWRILFKLGTKNLRRGNKGSSWRRGNRLTDGRPSQQQAACPGDSWKAGHLMTILQNGLLNETDTALTGP